MGIEIEAVRSQVRDATQVVDPGGGRVFELVGAMHEQARLGSSGLILMSN